ncbi:hypothetical protein [Pararhodobacter sp. SW119]|uniref:hypothetical protein n=1 Tax=Pararhodobacter sp. SW119 TaxID=2780075 RepID=UPI001ADF6B48|nr:hypothetical protein [Pararhodobacter sp. SW119]
MEKIRNDPAKLRVFCDQLTQNRAFWYETLTRLDHGLAMLGEGWKDDQYFAFKDEVSKVLMSLEDYMEQCQRTINELNRDAEALEKLYSIGR